MSRLTTIMYAEKWKSIPKGSEHKVIVVKNNFKIREKCSQIKNLQLLKGFKHIILCLAHIKQ